MLSLPKPPMQNLYPIFILHELLPVNWSLHSQVISVGYVSYEGSLEAQVYLVKFSDDRGQLIEFPSL